MTKRRAALSILLSALCLYGALLRFEAFHQAYGPLAGSRPFVRAQTGIAKVASQLHPASLAWARAEMPYRFDAKSYLDSAREMRHFYEARLREPLFVFATKVGLWATGGQDIAVSLVSGLSSALLVPATYALGAAIGGPAVGLGAAALVAIEPQLIDTGIRGYRDDLFALLTVLFAWNCVRLSRAPSGRVVLFTAVTGAAACLTRITALSFVIPGLVASAAVRGRRETTRPALVAAVLAGALVAPFLVNCWRQFGDPFYSINWHSAFYSQRSRIETGNRTDTGDLLLAQVERSPLATADSVLRGLTHYPWANKWEQFGRHWDTWLAVTLKYLCLAGLLMWLWSPSGRIALVVLASATLPFAFTWEAYADWRFTQHAYPFYMAAAVCSVVEPLRWIGRVLRNDQATRQRAGRTLRRTLVSAGVAAGFLGVMALLPPVIAYRELAHGRPASVGGDSRRVFFMTREAFFFANGWSGPYAVDNVTFRDPPGSSGRLRLLMRGRTAYQCLLRLDAASRAQGAPIIELRVNGSACPTSDPDVSDGVPRYWVTIPAGVVREGLNDVDIVSLSPTAVRRADSAGAEAPDAGFRFWYLRMFPKQSR